MTGLAVSFPCCIDATIPDILSVSQLRIGGTLVEPDNYELKPVEFVPVGNSLGKVKISKDDGVTFNNATAVTGLSGEVATVDVYSNTQVVYIEGFEYSDKIDIPFIPVRIEAYSLLVGWYIIYYGFGSHLWTFTSTSTGSVLQYNGAPTGARDLRLTRTS